jgi:hypothetical protein
MRRRLRLSILCLAIGMCAPLPGASSQTEAGSAETIACRVLESHASASPAVMVIVFHQQAREGQERLAFLLQHRSDQTVEIQVGG